MTTSTAKRLVFLCLIGLLAAPGALGQQWQWARSVTGPPTGGRWVNDVVADRQGNVYVAGSFTNAATFGSTTLSSRGGYDAYVAKMSSQGQWLWAQQIGGPDDDEAKALAIDTAGLEVYATGYFSQSVSFGAAGAITSSGGEDVFVAKLSSFGLWRWAAAAGGPANDDGRSVAVGPQGDVFVGSIFRGNATFGAGNTLTTRGLVDVAVARLSPTGQWQWAVGAGGSDSDFMGDVELLPSGDLAMSCYFFSPRAVVGTDTLTSTALLNCTNSFVAGVSAAGQWQWVRHLAGQNNTIMSLAADPSGDLFVGGGFHGPTAFDTISLTTPSPRKNEYDAFVGRLRAGTHRWQWVTTAGDTLTDAVENVIVMPGTGMLGVGGEFGYSSGGTVTGSQMGYFGALQAQSVGSADAFLGLMTTDGAWRTVLSGGSPDWDLGNGGLAFDGRETLYLGGLFAPGTRFGPVNLPVADAVVASATEFALGVPSAATRRLGLFPNPARRAVRLLGAPAGPVRVLDALGRVVLTTVVAPGAAETTLDVSGLPPGLYSVRAGSTARRLVVE